MQKMPMVEANRLSKMLSAVFVGEHRFPVDVNTLALEYSAQCFPDEPIVKISDLDIPGFEGVLARHPTQAKWKIGYNRAIQSSGRIRFTLAHEFGHYLLHRQIRSRFECTQRNMHDWDGIDKDIEAAADVFASYLLMPLDDFRRQLAGQDISIDLLLHLSDRYGVSPMAAALKWTEVEPRRMVVVAARDGHVLWARSSPSAFRSGAYLASRKQLIEVPAGSALNDQLLGGESHIAMQPARPWFHREQVDVELVEHVHMSSGSYPYALGLLVLPDAAPRWQEPDDELMVPVYEAFRLRPMKT